MTIESLGGNRKLEVLVNIDVDDLDAAVNFYQEAFGLSVGRRFGTSGVEMLGATSNIYLLAKPADMPAAASMTQRRSYRRHWTPVHLDFVVEDIGIAVERAQAAGGTLEQGIMTRDWGRMALMADPFGHGFCLLQFLARGYDEIS